MSSPIALVTGASRGIGRAIAVALGEAGCNVVISGRDQNALDSTLAALPAGSAAVAADLRNPGAVTKLLEAAPTGYDLVVNNAGTAPSARLRDTTNEDVASAWELHVGLPLRLLRAVVPGMIERAQAGGPRGCAIQLASTAGLRGFPFTSAYTAAKHGMVGLTRALAAEFAKAPVDLYAVCPGFVDTAITRQAAAAVAQKGKSDAAEALERMGAMNAIGRIHQPEEVAGAVVDLWRDRPHGCVYVLDREPPGFVD